MKPHTLLKSHIAVAEATSSTRMKSVPGLTRNSPTSLNTSLTETLQQLVDLKLQFKRINVKKSCVIQKLMVRATPPEIGMVLIHALMPLFPNSTDELNLKD